MKNTYSPIVLRTGGKLVLFDTGNGEAAAAQSNNERGTLNANLAAAGIDRNAIDMVVISHFHADHVNGLLAADNKRAAFPNAEIKVPANEWKFWMDDGEMSRASPGPDDRAVPQQSPRVRRARPQGHALRLGQGDGARRHRGRHARPQHRSHVLRRDLRRQDACSCSPTSATTRRVRAAPGMARLLRSGSAAGRGHAQRVYEMLVAEKLPVQAYHFPFPALATDREIRKRIPHDVDLRRLANCPSRKLLLRVVHCPSGSAHP